MKIPLIVIVGPTAVGKTALSLTIASRFNGEIISADSMQVYKGMDIGTAKATPEERSRIPHHLVDIVNPDYPFSVAEFQQRARRAICEIYERNRLPIIVGGTGLYVQSVTHHYRFSEANANQEIRDRWKTYCERHGKEALHDELRKVDPDTAERLHVNDVRRIIRALEIYELTGKTMSEYLRRQAEESPYDPIWIGLTMERKVLYARINQRVDEMIRDGLVDEVIKLREKGYTLDLVSMQGLGYKEIMMYLEGKWPLKEAIEMIKQSTRRFAKRQWSWFRRIKEITWWDMTNEQERQEKIADICRYVETKLATHLK